jgi:son of sevenless
VAQEGLRLGNFNLIFEVTSGMTNSAVFRLSKTWDGVKSGQSSLTNVVHRVAASGEDAILNASPSRFWQEMERLVSSSKNFQYYKAQLRRKNAPCIPYLGVNLSGLTFIEQGNNDFLPDPKGEKPDDYYVNFYKRSLIAQVINQSRQYQMTPYNLSVVPELQRLFLRVPALDEKDAYAASLLAEPRETS